MGEGPPPQHRGYTATSTTHMTTPPNCVVGLPRKSAERYDTISKLSLSSEERTNLRSSELTPLSLGADKLSEDRWDSLPTSRTTSKESECPKMNSR